MPSKRCEIKTNLAWNEFTKNSCLEKITDNWKRTSHKKIIWYNVIEIIILKTNI